MKEAAIRKYAGLMAEFGLTGLEITEENTVIRLERTVSAVPVSGMHIPVGIQSVEESAASVQTNDTISVRSPMVGVFYAAPAEDAEPFIHAGDAVEKGKTLCIIEAMKLMNEIAAEQDGIITEICVKNGQVVDYGTELFRMKRN